MKVTRLWIVFLPVAFLLSLTCFAQTNVNEEQGLKPYESLHGGDLDSISMTNGGMVSHAPLASYPQRGSLSGVASRPGTRSLVLDRGKANGRMRQGHHHSHARSAIRMEEV